jgi:AcrR family transcriptional regulator
MYICSWRTFGFKISHRAANAGKILKKNPKDVSESHDVATGQIAARRRDAQAVRSERTREALLSAAEIIFAKEGFEASRIEDIAAEAGRSRGAFYANFENKTEVFLALRTILVRRRAAALRTILESILDQRERYEALIQYILSQICDTPVLLLQIEFKLFALRHPEMLAELSEKHLDASTTINMEELSGLFPPQDRPEALKQVRIHTLAMEAVLEGFGLNALFGPSVLDGAQIEALVPALLEHIFAEL